jgi:hypothetical protein
MSGLYLPGYGYRSTEEAEIDRACKAHDSDLVFKRHPDTQHLTIFQRLQRESVYVQNADAADLVEGDLFPLRAFPNRIPSVEEVNRWLYESDRERGDLLEKVQRHNAKLKAQMHADMQPEIRHRAELLEHGFRMLGTDTGRIVSTPNNGKRRRSFG